MENIPLAREAEPTRRPRTWFIAFLLSSVGKKSVMATTGTILVLYVIVHLLGNLQFYQSPEAINQYAEFLHARPAALWTARVILLAAVFLHVIFGIMLWIENRGARPFPYVMKKEQAANFASKTMIWSGAIIAAFIVVHILHLTTGTIEAGSFVSGEVFQNMVAGFRNPLISGIYVVGMIFLWFHLYHGIQSLFLTFGFSNPKYETVVRRGARTLAYILAIGDILFPLAVLLGFVR